MIKEYEMNHHDYANTPPMGWNSWDCYGASVTEQEVRKNAEWMALHLKPFGWEYVVVDIQWYEPTADSSRYHAYAPLEMDEWSRLMPAVNRFPSAVDGKGFKPLAEFVHGLGLKFGIHIMRGIPRQAVHAASPIIGTDATARDVAHPNSICPWNTDMYGVDPKARGVQAYYDSLFALYAEWGVDFIKGDDIAASRLYGTHVDEIKLIRKAIDGCGRRMVLSLSPGPAPLDLAGCFIENADMWRITDDYWDRWELLLDMFSRCEAWYPHVGSGHWPDCDMLPLGHIGIRSVDGGGGNRLTRFTRDEQVTMMTLWTIFRSPLMVGGELTDTDEWTLSLLTNPEVLAVHTGSSHNRPLFRDGPFIAWAAEGASGERFMAFFNTGGTLIREEVPLVRLGIDYPARARDLWKHEELSMKGNQITLDIPVHGAKLIKFAPLGKKLRNFG
jgi:hypothetical protein